MKNIKARNPVFNNNRIAERLQTAKMKNKIECIGLSELGTIKAQVIRLNLKKNNKKVVMFLKFYTIRLRSNGIEPLLHAYQASTLTVKLRA